jgi:hypothetical protein
VFYWPLVFGIPVLLAALLVVAAAIRIERTEPLYLAIVLAAVIGYATIVRLPPGPPMPQAP